MHVDDLGHGLGIWKTDVVKEAAPQKSVGQLLFIVAGDHYYGPVLGAYGFPCLVHIEFHAVQLAQQVVGKFDIRLVDLIDEQHRLNFAVECLPQIALHDVVVDVLDPRIAQLGIAKPRHGIVFIQSLLGLGRGFDMPLVERLVQGSGDLVREQGLARARLTP